MNGVVVLDSWALLGHLQGEGPACEAVAGLLERTRPTVSWINLGEVFYILRRRRGEAEAMAAVRDLQDVLTLDLPSAGRIVAAARIKSDHAMAYADAFAAATAIAIDATLWTGDPELLVDGAAWRWRDLRPHPMQ